MIPTKRTKQYTAIFRVGSVRNLRGWKRYVFMWIGFLMALYQVWIILYPSLDPITEMAIHLAFILILTFFIYRFSSFEESTIGVLFDLLFILFSASCGIYYTVHSDRIATRTVGIDQLTDWDILFGVLFILLCVEAARRTIGFGIITIALLFIIYALFGHHLTGIWHHHEMTKTEVLDQLAYSFNGLWGSPIAVAASFVFVFVLFGSFLHYSGASQFFFDLSIAIAGRTKGGAAKIAILASAFFGMISGSPTANVVTTGAFTIPMAKKTGYSSRFAAAVEACASTGGSILPPIMGSSAFLMAAVTGIPYTSIAIAAILPGILYYFSLFLMVHLEAIRTNLPVVEGENIPKVKKVLKAGWYHFIPLIVLLTLLLKGTSPSRSGIYAIIVVIIISMFTKRDKFSIQKIIAAASHGAKAAIPISTACASAGLVIAGIMTTGLAGKLNSIILNITAGYLLPTLLLVMIMCIILGMGMPVAAAYILTAMLAAPTLINLGISEMSAHLFIVYFSIISAITPPVAVAAFAAAGIAKENPTRVGFEAIRIGAASLIIPFGFIFHASLLMDGTVIEIVYSVFIMMISLFALSSGIIGYMNGMLKVYERILLVVSSSLIISANMFITILGIILLLFVYFLSKKASLLLGGLNQERNSL